MTGTPDLPILPAAASDVLRNARKGGTTMAAYLIAIVKVTDDAWVPDYAAKVHDIAAKHGGKYLSRSGNIDTLEGEALEADLIALIQFPDKAALRAFVDDPEYAPFAKARKKGAHNRFYAIDDTDLAGGVPYLPGN
jgi:uncharacterized protein (DUF1330 family)